MRLIVGLGNPGVEYGFTPHNLGFLAVDRLAEEGNIRVVRPEAKSHIGRGEIAGEEVVLAKPQTMMNLSGMAVRELLARLELTPAELIVLCDEVMLPFGMIRVGERGSAGTHNGMKSVVSGVGTTDFCRVRLGVQPDHDVKDLAAYVLHPMRNSEMEDAAEMIDQAAQAVEVILKQGVAKAMNQFNRRVPPPEEKNSYLVILERESRGHMEERLYDLIFITRPATPEDEIAKIMKTLEQVIADHKGTIVKNENWGTKRLAYRVAKNREGIFIYLQMTTSDGEMVKELERRLKVAEPVIKYQTVRLDEEMKLQKKLVARRELKLSRKPRRTVPPAAAAPSAAPAAPVTPPAPPAEPAPAAS
jgi:PTH1 family peptidyl-tRNA hydrolase